MELGIDEIYLASDGQEGLREAALHKPEIILSDVRMPRMDGIMMMDLVRKTLPDTVFIFMSGYSDKEYLKAAIRLQAVSYVEKPLDLQEVKAAVISARERCQTSRQHHIAQSVSDTVSASHLAMCLTVPYETTRDTITDLSKRYCQKYGSPELFHAAFTLLLQIDSRTDLMPSFFTSLEADLHDFVRTLHLHVICAEKRTNLFVFHFFRKESFSVKTVETVSSYLADALPQNLSFYIACGQIVSGIPQLYDSYSAAVIELQHCYFDYPGTRYLTSTHDFLSQTSAGSESAKAADASPNELSEELLRAIREADGAQMDAACEALFAACLRNASLMRRSVQSLYLRGVSAITEQRRVRQLPGAVSGRSEEDYLDLVGQCFSYPELHELLTKTIDEYKQDLSTYVPENSSVHLIKTYIRQHFGDPMLSTKEISEYASLSASYACTVFKHETGQTLNQYLTEYRLERAKELLADPRINISEIAGRVGYNDSNYFGKAFKKYTGLSPSEFRGA